MVALKGERDIEEEEREQCKLQGEREIERVQEEDSSKCNLY